MAWVCPTNEATRDSEMKLSVVLMNALAYASKHVALMLMEMKTSDSQYGLFLGECFGLGSISGTI
jgi:hypothetical protein